VLIRFEVENYRSIFQPVNLSMVAIDEDRDAARWSDRISSSLLTTAAVLGPNASGKSNILASLAWLRDAVRNSLRAWDDSIPTEPFAFSVGPRRDTLFDLEMLVNGVRFEYQLALNAERVSYEGLFHYPEGRRRRIFEREGNDLVLQRGLGELAGTRALLTDRSLALSIMRRFDEPDTGAFARAVLGISSLGLPLNRFRRPPSQLQATMRIFADHNPDVDVLPVFEEDDGFSLSERERALSLLKLADLGVVDVEIEETEVELNSGERYTRRTPQLVHSADSEHRSFDLREESAGTRAWFELIGPVLAALERGSIVLFDELDASLHPTLTVRLMELFQLRSSNPLGAQLVFTTHDTNLLNHLNRDEVWLTQKSSDGSTRLGALSDFAGERVRKSTNLESAYLSGRFGALPDTGRLEVLRDLGLIG
jgi:predicted ATPase